MLNGKNRLIVGIVLATWFVITAVFTSKLEPTQSTEQFLDDDHPLQRSLKILESEFPKTQDDPLTKINFIWGLGEVDRSGVNQLFDPKDIGTPTYVEGFTFNKECQTKILSACETLRTSDEFDEFILRKSGVRSVDCFVEELGAYKVDPSATCIEKSSQAWQSDAWQVTGNLTAILNEFVETDSCNDLGKTIKEYYDESLGWDGKNLRYVGISVESSFLDPFAVPPEAEVRVHYDKFIEFAKQLDDDMESVCNSKTMMTDLNQKFVFMNNQVRVCHEF